MTLVFPPNWICMYNSCLCTLKFWFGHWWIFSSAAQLCLTLRPHGLQHTRFPCLSLTLRACSNWSPPSWMKSIQPSHSLSSPSPAFYLSQHQGLFKWVSSSHQVAKVLEFQLQHQSLQWIFRVDFLQDWLAWSPCSPRDSQETSPAPQFKGIHSSGLSLSYCPPFSSIHDYWKYHSFHYMGLYWHSNVSAF